MPQFHENIVNTVREPLVVLDKSLQVRIANNAFYRMFGLSRPDAEAHSFFALGGGQWNIPELRRLLEEVICNNSVFEDFEVDYHLPVGGRKVMIVNARQIHGGGADGILVAIEDITARRQADRMLQALNAKLRHRNRELQDFAQVASHDLQEPLRKILAFGDRLETAVGPLLNEPGGSYLQRMLQAAMRMQTLINGLLAYCRIETKGSAFTEVDFGTIVREVLDDLETQIQNTGATVRLGAEFPKIEADALQVRQLLQNLIGNALKYHKSGVPPVVTVSAALVNDTLPAGETLPICRVTVEDCGIGFDEKYLDRIFAVFQRLHGRNEYEGTGIGLAVCRKIVERHGGSITATSTLGEGAVFVVSLPVQQVSHGESWTESDGR